MPRTCVRFAGARWQDTRHTSNTWVDIWNSWHCLLSPQLNMTMLPKATKRPMTRRARILMPRSPLQRKPPKRAMTLIPGYHPLARPTARFVDFCSCCGPVRAYHPPTEANNRSQLQGAGLENQAQPTPGPAPEGGSNDPPVEARVHEFFLPRHRISRKVITVDIHRYLGNDVLVRPGTYKVTFTWLRARQFLMRLSPHRAATARSCRATILQRTKF